MIVVISKVSPNPKLLHNEKITHVFDTAIYVYVWASVSTKQDHNR